MNNKHEEIKDIIMENITDDSKKNVEKLLANHFSNDKKILSTQNDVTDLMKEIQAYIKPGQRRNTETKLNNLQKKFFTKKPKDETGSW